MATKLKLINLHEPQRKFISTLADGKASHVIRQCLDIGAALAERGLLGSTGFDMDRVMKTIGGRKRK